MLQGAPKINPFTTPISLSHLHHPHRVIVPTASSSPGYLSPKLVALAEGGHGDGAGPAPEGPPCHIPTQGGSQRQIRPRHQGCHWHCGDTGTGDGVHRDPCDPRAATPGSWLQPQLQRPMEPCDVPSCHLLSPPPTVPQACAPHSPPGCHRLPGTLLSPTRPGARTRPQDPPPSVSPCPQQDKAQRGREAALFGGAGVSQGGPQDSGSFPLDGLVEVDASGHRVDGHGHQRPEALDTHRLWGQEVSQGGGTTGTTQGVPPNLGPPNSRPRWS